jgi:peptidoglycan/LPS O-acetylase OafA/YrhL
MFAVAFILFIITQQNEKSLLANIVEYDFFVFIGKISYSLYLWHNLIPYLEFIEAEGQRFFARLTILFTLSTLSYFLLEKPLLSLKKHIK